MTKCITLKNERGHDVTKGICHYVSANLIIDNDNQPLGKDCVAIQIVESLLEQDVPFD